MNLNIAMIIPASFFFEFKEGEDDIASLGAERFYPFEIYLIRNSMSIK
jgi:hypothetical protein